MSEIETATTEAENPSPILSQPDEEKEDMSALNAAQESKDALSALDHDDLFAGFDPEDEEDIEEDDLNDPYQRELDPDPVLDDERRSRDFFGRTVESLGQASSPRIYAAAAKFPNCTQLRVWKRENGTPVLLGVIDAMATMEDFVEYFWTAMPKPGERRCQYEVMPVDINGKEFDKAHTLFISEHHEALTRIRKMKEYESRMGDDDGPYNRRYGFDRFDRRGDDASVTMASEMSRMFDHMLTTQDRKSQHLERTLEEERRRQQEREAERARERVDLATNAAQGVQVLTERMMNDESQRAERAQKAQAEQGTMLLTTLTSIFSQQQTMMQASMDAARRADEYRLEQERQRAQRERQEADERRARDRLEMESRQRAEREEAERKMLAERSYLEQRIAREMKEMDLKIQREREEVERKSLRESAEREARERWLSEERNRREVVERHNQKEREGERQRRHDMMMRELEIRKAQDREHSERMMILSRQELANNAMGGITELLPKATGFLASMGMEPADMVQRLFAPPQEEKSGWAEAVPQLLGVAGEVAKAALIAKAGAGAGPGMPGMPPGLPQLPPGVTPEMVQEQMKAMTGGGQEYEDADYEDESPQHLVTPPPTGYEPPRAPEGEAISFRQTKLGAAESQGKRSSLSLNDQKMVRNAIRDLLKNLSTSSEDEWIGHITGAITNVPNIYIYIKERTVKTALEETGAPPALIGKVLATMQGSGLIPTDIHIGE